MAIRLFILAVFLLLPRVAFSQANPANSPTSSAFYRIDPKTPQALMDLLKYTGESVPLVSGHRGGAAVGYPENCIATFEHTLRHGFAMLEIDPRYAKDGAIVVHHDPTLNRTTTGKGLAHRPYAGELKQLKLKDIAGNVTEHQIPTLDEVLEWARGKTVLVLDQKDVPAAARVKKIEEHKAESYAMLIVYTYKDVQECYALNPNIMMEVMIPNREKFAEFDQLGVPWKNVIAFVGHIPPEDAGAVRDDPRQRGLLHDRHLAEPRPASHQPPGRRHQAARARLSRLPQARRRRHRNRHPRPARPAPLRLIARSLRRKKRFSTPPNKCPPAQLTQLNIGQLGDVVGDQQLGIRVQPQQRRGAGGRDRPVQARRTTPRCHGRLQ